MSVLQNPVRHQPTVVSAKLTRWLLLCRFDFQQKVWGLPASEIHRDQPFVSPADAAAAVSVIIQNFPGYSASSELESRHSSRRPFQKKSNRLQVLAFQTKGVATRAAELLRCPCCKICNQLLKHENTNQHQARFTFHQFRRSARRRSAAQHLQNF